MIDTLLIAGITVASLLLGAALLHLLPRFGKAGRFLSEAMSRAPMLDLIITYFTIAPLVAGPMARGWPGLLGGVIGQVAAVVIWTVLHALAHRAARRGPRILKVLNQVVGPWRNYTALWITAIVVPMFWIGLHPTFFLNRVDRSANQLLERMVARGAVLPAGAGIPAVVVSRGPAP